MEYKEKTKLIDKDLDFTNFTDIDIANCIEISYYLAKFKDLSELNNIIGNYAMDGINTYAVFIRFCYIQYITTYSNTFWSLEEMLEDNSKILIEEFIEKYFEEEK